MHKITQFLKGVTAVKKYPLNVASDITGIPQEEIASLAREMAQAKLASLIWNQGLTQHTVGTNNTRIMPILQMILGNIGKNGGGVNILRGHDNVQGASDMGNLADTLPGYYGLGETAWKHFCNHWRVDYEWMKGRFKSKEMMEKTGYALSTWRFGVLDKENFENNANTELKALVVIGNGISTTSLLDKTKKPLIKWSLLYLSILMSMMLLCNRSKRSPLFASCSFSNGESLLSNLKLPDSKIAGHPAITSDNIEKILNITLTKTEREAVKGTSFATGDTNILVDKCLEAGICPYGNGKDRMIV